MVPNPTYDAENKFDVDQDMPGSDTNLELVYGIELEERRWEWALYPVNQTHLPFLADPSEHSGVLKVTLGSDGKWKGLQSDGTTRLIDYDTRPAENELYLDYGYAPECSPYGPNGAKFSPIAVNPRGYEPSMAPTKSRQDSAGYNTTLFIGNIDRSVTTQELEQIFLQFGQRNYVNRVDQTSAFFQFAQRRDALMAMRQMQGVPMHSCRLRISWGDPTIMSHRNIRPKHGPLPYKGNGRPQEPRESPQPQVVPRDGNQHHEQQRRCKCQCQNSNNRPVPSRRQQQFQMPQTGYPPHGNAAWPPVQYYQRRPYQQHVVRGHQRMDDYHHMNGHQHINGYPHMAQPPPPSSCFFPAPSHQPVLPQNANSGQTSRLNPRAPRWEDPKTGQVQEWLQQQATVEDQSRTPPEETSPAVEGQLRSKTSADFEGKLREPHEQIEELTREMDGLKWPVPGRDGSESAHGQGG